MSTEERADYMMDAFLDEQNTLIRPLVNRKLHLVKTLDERATVVERIILDKRGELLGHTWKKPADLVSLIETLEDDLEQLCEEKVNVLLQLMDLVKRPYDTILEVEAVLRAATDHERVVSPVRRTQAPQTNASEDASAIIANLSSSAVPEEELWCFCRKTDDGRQMVACDNPKCDLVWWHLDCIDRYIAANRIGVNPPSEEEGDSKKWHCPVCIAQEIVNRENGEADKVRRRRR